MQSLAPLLILATVALIVLAYWTKWRHDDTKRAVFEEAAKKMSESAADELVRGLTQWGLAKWGVVALLALGGGLLAPKAYQATTSFAPDLVAAWGPGIGFPGSVGSERSGGSPSSTAEPDAPSTINTLEVASQTDTSITLRWVAVDNGEGSIAYHAIRADTTTSGFGWGHAIAQATEVFDSTGTNIGDTITYEFLGLSAGTYYEFGIKAYRCDVGSCPPGATYGATSNIVNGTTDASSPPSTPTITSVNVTDTSTVAVTSSSFGGGGTHDSTQWQWDRPGGGFSAPIIDTVSTSLLTSITMVDNTTFKADTSYMVRVRHYSSTGGWGTYSDSSVYTNTQPTTGDSPLEPDNFTTIFDNPFDAEEPSGWTLTELFGSYSIQTDGTAPTSSSVGEMLYPLDMPSSHPPARLATTFSGHDSLYVFVNGFKVSSNFVAPPASGIAKMFFIVNSVDTGDGGYPWYVNMRSRGGCLQLEVTQQGAAGSARLRWDDATGVYSGDPNEVTAVAGGDGSEGCITADTYFDLVFLFVGNTSGSANGQVKVWKRLSSDTNDPTAYMAYTSVQPLTTGTTGYFDGFKWDPTWGGGSGETVPAEQYQRTDRIYASGN